MLAKKGMKCSVINARFVKPIDTEMIRYACKTHRLIVTMEENVASGGFGERVRAYIDTLKTDVKLITVNIPDEYVEHGNVDILRKEVGIDEETIFNRIYNNI